MDRTTLGLWRVLGGVSSLGLRARGLKFRVIGFYSPP